MKKSTQPTISFLYRTDDGLDGPALPVLPSPIVAAGAALHRNVGGPELAAAARIGADYGRNQPQCRVSVRARAKRCIRSLSDARAGACRRLRRGHQGAGALPVTVKCRTGVDEQDPEAALGLLAERVVTAGCAALIVHARIAWLKGLSPRENRDLPPLDYALVHALKQRFPNVPVVLNGGLAALAEMRAELDHVDGVMVGRASRRDAIRNEDIAFVLSDVCMPQLDGF
jgi:tRNA-dihydrouridine synthase A